MKPQRSIVVLLLVLIAGCGASQRERALRATFVATNAARDGFVTLDRERQQRIIDDAKTLEEGRAALAAYRQEREKTVLIFEDVYRALVAATLANDTGSFDAAKKAAERLMRAIDNLKKAASP